MRVRGGIWNEVNLGMWGLGEVVGRAGCWHEAVLIFSY